MNACNNINNFAISCDENGNILSIISKGNIEKIFNVGNNLYEYIEAKSNEKYFDFLKAIRTKGYVIDFEVNFNFKGNSLYMSLNGIYEKSKILIFGLCPHIELNEILNDVLRMNSSYVNQLRSKIKDYYLNNENLDQSVYSEISRLNNELINSKRVIEKQNAKLLEYTKSLENIALLDSLTGAYNRRGFNIKINEYAERIRKDNSVIVLTAIDFDNFKMVNDKFGHSSGDELLQKFVVICKDILRKDLDLIFRIGGDEFIIMSLNINEEEATKFIEEINKQFKKCTKISELSYGIIGIKAS
ncbi:GGDEF domain-containing protein [Clostridium sp. C2-6-12]|uniref:GGDEF domain-containing protein n=1 Tax=Clostridium sp. C2-6-12 TaxID=2698832 RepID=UPI001923ECA4|nr:GGDEF domain-containing protein [Clostridium sp. C2-6-12]